MTQPELPRPYRIPLDTQRFTSLTTRTTDPNKTNVVLMGYTTWASLPAAYRPLPNRLNAVLTRSPEKAYAVREAGAYPFLKVEYVCGFLQQVASQGHELVVPSVSRVGRLSSRRAMPRRAPRRGRRHPTRPCAPSPPSAA